MNLLKATNTTTASHKQLATTNTRYNELMHWTSPDEH